MSPEEQGQEPTQETSATPKKKVWKGSHWEVYFPVKISVARDDIYVASFPPIIFMWPTILVFFLCGVLQSMGVGSPGALGWLAILTFAVNMLVIVQDFDQKRFVILILTIAVLGLLIWIINMKGFGFLKEFAQSMRNLNPSFSTSAYLIISTLLALMFLWGLIGPAFNYWKFEHNEFTHFVQPFGKDHSIPRVGATVTKEIPDLLEYFLTFGGATLVISRDGRVVERIPNIPFLSRRMKAIDSMLSETRVRNVSEE